LVKIADYLQSGAVFVWLIDRSRPGRRRHAADREPGPGCGALRPVL